MKSNKYLIKIAGALDAKLGMPQGQKVPGQTLQVMSQVGDPQTKKQARGVMNLEAKGGHNHPRSTSVLTQKIPHIKAALFNDDEKRVKFNPAYSKEVNTYFNKAQNKHHKEHHSDYLKILRKKQVMHHVKNTTLGAVLGGGMGYAATLGRRGAIIGAAVGGASLGLAGRKNFLTPALNASSEFHKPTYKQVNEWVKKKGYDK